jgi:hypothetical protein
MDMQRIFEALASTCMVIERISQAPPEPAWVRRRFLRLSHDVPVQQRICQAPAEPAWTCRGFLFLRPWHDVPVQQRICQALLSLHGHAEDSVKFGFWGAGKNGCFPKDSPIAGRRFRGPA